MPLRESLSFLIFHVKLPNAHLRISHGYAIYAPCVTGNNTRIFSVTKRTIISRYRIGEKNNARSVVRRIVARANRLVARRGINGDSYVHITYLEQNSSNRMRNIVIHIFYRSNIRKKKYDDTYGQSNVSTQRII